MSVFQILKNNVLIIDGDKSYMDTVDNFLADAGAVSVPESVIYDDAQECCVVDGEFLSYPKLNGPMYRQQSPQQRTKRRASRQTMTVRSKSCLTPWQWLY